MERSARLYWKRRRAACAASEHKSLRELTPGLFEKRFINPEAFFECLGQELGLFLYRLHVKLIPFTLKFQNNPSLLDIFNFIVADKLPLGYIKRLLSPAVLNDGLGIIAGYDTH